MFDCEVRLDITLSEKRSSSANVDFKVVVGVKIAGGEKDGGNWRQLDKPDPRIPSEGRWVPVPTGVILKGGPSQNFAYLKTMGVPPQAGATGEIQVFSPGQREYLSSNLAWCGHGNFEVLAGRFNVPYPEAPWTLTVMKRNIWDNVGTFLGWKLTTTQGFSAAKGAAAISSARDAARGPGGRTSRPPSTINSLPFGSIAGRMAARLSRLRQRTAAEHATPVTSAIWATTRPVSHRDARACRLA